MSQEAFEIWSELVAGSPVDRSRYAPVDGRLDLRQLSLVGATRKPIDATGGVNELVGLIILRGIRFAGVDFSGSALCDLRLFDSIFENCVFDKAKCRGWRAWNTSFNDCRFRGTDLRDSALGGIKDGRQNSFTGVEFVDADLRGLACSAARFLRSSFVNCKLDKIDFQGSSFVDCRFEGVLNDVLFYRTAHSNAGEIPPNEMLRVDFRKAAFRSVQFRGLDLSSVEWPSDDEVIVVDDYRRTLNRVVAALKGREDMPSRKLCVSLESDLKWAGPRQERGVVSKRDIVDRYGAEGVELVRRLAGLI